MKLFYMKPVDIDVPGCLTDEDFLIFVEHLDLGAGEIHEYREADRRDAETMLIYEQLALTLRATQMFYLDASGNVQECRHVQEYSL